MKDILPNDNYAAEKVSVYDRTADCLNRLIEDFSYYHKVMGLFKDSKGKVELKKRFMLKMIDEEWVNIIEDTIPSLDLIIRNPGRLLQETEELRPIEQTRRVSSRSIQHLVQHTDLINEIRKDGTVMPAKLLNVFQDDTYLTYENRFINTLINRLYAFVSLRVDAAEECGVDEKLSTLTFEQPFTDGDRTGSISLKIQVSEPPKEFEVVKNYVYQSDLWKRVLRIRRLVTSYMDSSFCRMVGKNYVRPPIMRTNLLLKNVDFRQCLTLWEFLESYENTGYETLIQEDVEGVSNDLLRDFYNSLASQYALFEKHVRNYFEFDSALDMHGPVMIPEADVKDKLDPINIDEFSFSEYHPVKKEQEGLNEWEQEVDFAVRVALAADSLIRKEQQDSEEEAHIKDGKVLFKYRYSFLARLILAQDPTQSFYSDIKNHILSYKKVRSGISWNFETFFSGRNKVARINVRGKTLYLYLPVYIEDQKYRLISLDGTKRNKGFFSLIKVRSKRGVKYAKELIDLVMQNLNLVKIPDFTPTDYHIPYADKDEMCLWEPPLVKIIGEPNIAPEDYPFSKEVKDKIIPVSEEAVLPEGYTYRYRYSFKARLIQASEPLQSYYGEIRNYLDSFKKVKVKSSFKHDAFRYGRSTFVRMNIRGKSLRVYFDLEPKDFVNTKYRLKDLTEKGAQKDLKAMLKVKSSRGVKYAKQLIDLILKDKNAVQGDIPDNDYYWDYMTTEQLLNAKEPLIKRVAVKSDNDFFSRFKSVKTADNQPIAGFLDGSASLPEIPSNDDDLLSADFDALNNNFNVDTIFTPSLQDTANDSAADLVDTDTFDTADSAAAQKVVSVDTVLAGEELSDGVEEPLKSEVSFDMAVLDEEFSDHTNPTGQTVIDTSNQNKEDHNKQILGEYNADKDTTKAPQNGDNGLIDQDLSNNTDFDEADNEERA